MFGFLLKTVFENKNNPDSTTGATSVIRYFQYKTTRQLKKRVQNMPCKQFLLKAQQREFKGRTFPTCSFCVDQEVQLFSDYDLPWLNLASAFEC